MISPHTPPGTALVVVWIPTTVEEILTTVKPEYHEQAAQILSQGTINLPLWVGQRVTLDRIIPEEFMLLEHLAMIVGYPESKFPLESFKIAELPKTLTSLLVPELEPA